jgi:DNA-binding transcriptional LysR family regulator
VVHRAILSQPPPRRNRSIWENAFCFPEGSCLPMHFHVTDLRLFVAAAEERNLTRAAAARQLSLAAASARIKALEDQVGLPLFVREARGLSLTPPGEAFLHHARAILRQTHQLRADLQEYGGGLRGHLRVFANTTAVTDILPDILPRYLKEHPRINIDLQEKPNAEIARGVLEGAADLGIAAGEVDTLGLQAIHFSTDRLVLATARGHRFARRKRIAFEETLGEDAVGMHPASTLQAFLAGVTERLGKPQKLRIQLSSFDAMCRMIGAGVGIGILPESTALRWRDAAGLRLVELSNPWSVRKRFILTRDSQRLPGYAKDLVDLIVRRHA